MQETHDDSGMGEDAVQGDRGEGREKERATPPIGDEGQRQGQTQHDAPDDDAGSQRGGEDRPGA